MKKIYVLLLIAAVTILAVQAQPFEKGDKLLGGSLGYGIDRNTYNSYSTPPPGLPNQSYDYRYYNFSISPALGFFTKPNRLIGFSLLFQHGKSIPNNSYKQKTYTVGVGFFKQYWNDLGKNFYFNIQGRTGANYNVNSFLYTSPQLDQTKGVNAYLSIEPGFAYRIKKRLVLDAYYSNFLSANYYYNERSGNSGLLNRNYGVSVASGLQNFSLGNVTVGFRYVL